MYILTYMYLEHPHALYIILSSLLFLYKIYIKSVFGFIHDQWEGRLQAFEICTPSYFHQHFLTCSWNFFQEFPSVARQNFNYHYFIPFLFSSHACIALPYEHVIGGDTSCRFICSRLSRLDISNSTHGNNVNIYDN